MLRYKTKTRPGLVALYDIWPGNGAGPFLQPRSPHGVKISWMKTMLSFYGQLIMYVTQMRITVATLNTGQNIDDEH